MYYASSFVFISFTMLESSSSCIMHTMYYYLKSFVSLRRYHHHHQLCIIICFHSFHYADITIITNYAYHILLFKFINFTMSISSLSCVIYSHHSDAGPSPHTPGAEAGEAHSYLSLSLCIYIYIYIYIYIVYWKYIIILRMIGIMNIRIIAKATRANTPV